MNETAPQPTRTRSLPATRRGSRLVVFGEVLEDWLGDRPVPGGAPLNVARHLLAFGFDPLLISRVGHDGAGERLLARLGAMGLDTSGIQRDPRHPTGRAVARTNGGINTFEIPVEQAFDFIDAAQALAAAEAAQREGLAPLYFGTLASRHDASREALAALVARAAGGCYVDLNLRAPWYDPGRVAHAVLAADFLQMTDDELDVVASFLGLPEGRGPRAVSLMSRFAIRRVIVTSGAHGAHLFTDDGAEHHAPAAPRRSTAGDTVGAGDALASVLLLGMDRGWQDEQALARAGVFARAVCALPGALPALPEFYQPFLDSWLGEGAADARR